MNTKSSAEDMLSEKLQNKLKRIHLQIQGQNHEIESTMLLESMAKSLGLTGYAKQESGTVLVVMEGNRDLVWDMVKELTNTTFKANIDEILFYFQEPEGNFSNFSLI